MYNCSDKHRYKNVINNGAHQIALVSMVTTVSEKSLLFESCWKKWELKLLFDAIAQ